MVMKRPEQPELAESEGGRTILYAALSLIPLAVLSGVAIDFAVRFVMNQKLDAVAQSALASALAQSRALRDGRYDVTVEEMELKGRSRADIVFNAQKPSVRDISTTFTLKQNDLPKVYDARVAYVASVNTVFLRFVGIAELEIAGVATASWVARDALIDDRFEDQKAEVMAAGRKALPSPSGWQSSERTKPGGAPLVLLADARRYAGPPPPEKVKIAVDFDASDGNVSISKKFSAEPGSHQLRYWYRDRAEGGPGAPAWLCGTREDDTEWMSGRDKTPTVGVNRISVHLSSGADKDAPPAVAALGASTRIDSCYSSGHRWIERAVKIDILARGDYWLTFRGDGRRDGAGAAIANILFCREPCADDGLLAPPASNFPWSPGETILQESFEEAAGASPPHPAGWTLWPGRSATYKPAQGGASGYVELDASKGDGFENQRMGRPVLLTPGFYRLRYNYSVGPSSPHKEVACNYFGLEAARQRASRGPGADTHRITLIIDPDRPYLHPEAAGSGDQAKLNWYSADHSLEREAASPKRPHLPDPANAADYCVGAPPDVVVTRDIAFRVDKAGYYWITFAADGPADGQGGRISAVKLSALGARFAGQGIPRILRYKDPADVTTPPIGALLIQPPGASGERALYRVQVQ